MKIYLNSTRVSSSNEDYLILAIASLVAIAPKFLNTHKWEFVKKIKMGLPWGAGEKKDRKKIS
ncbi:MAG: hypothetical protein AB4426_14170 [Xenococcaceae cyanobacterium]